MCTIFSTFFGFVTFSFIFALFKALFFNFYTKCQKTTPNKLKCFINFEDRRPKLAESESGRTVSEKVKLIYFDVYLSTCHKQCEIIQNKLAKLRRHASQILNVANRVVFNQFSFRNPKLIIDRVLFFVTPLTDKKFHSLPTLSSHNSCSKPLTPLILYIFGILRTSVFTWWYPEYVVQHQNLE